jgi:poly-beta-1,6-N-acetyl-D-glucosamine synthase
MHSINVLSYFTLGTYCSMLLVLLFGWLRIKKEQNQVPISRKGVLLSVIIPFRNEENSLVKLLFSLENQSLKKENFEVIFVNDQSVDSSLEILENFATKDAFSLKIMHLEQNRVMASPKKKCYFEGY